MHECNIFLNFFILVSLVISARIQTSDACGGVLNKGKGVITSPNFPDLYNSNQNCIWKIVGPPKSRIRLNSTHFDLENHAKCNYDYVKISTQSFNDSDFMHEAKYCGIEIPPVVVSEGNFLQIEFKSDAAKERSGFSALYSIEGRHMCGMEIPCDDSMCIGRRLWCDGTADCEDESDEKYCRIKTRWIYSINNNCNATRHFTCKNGMCIPKALKCDGLMDCYDHSDETQCDIENVERATDPTDDSIEFETVPYDPELDYSWNDYNTQSSTSLSQNPLTHPVSGPKVSTAEPPAGYFDETGPSRSNSNAGSPALPFSNSQSTRGTSPFSHTAFVPIYLPGSPRNYLNISINFPFGQRLPAQETPLPVDRKLRQNQGMEFVPDFLKSKPSSIQFEPAQDIFTVDNQDRNVRKSNVETSSRNADPSYSQNDYVPRPLIALLLFPNSYPLNIRVNAVQ